MSRIDLTSSQRGTLFCYKLIPLGLTTVGPTISKDGRQIVRKANRVKHEGLKSSEFSEGTT